jgi:hypothetical protein
LTDMQGSDQEASGTDDAIHVDEAVDAEPVDASAPPPVENENKRRSFLTFFSPKRADTSATKSPKPTSERKPLGNLGPNLGGATPLNDDMEEEGDEVADLWVEPKVKVKIDPKTGKYKRPKGRMPSGVECWDETKGKWRLSMA